MKKKLLLLVAILICTISYSQTIVQTTKQLRNVVLEEYTGIHCGYCPDGHARAELINSNNPGRVVLINIHQGGYAVPSGNEPDFRTQFGDSLADQTGLTGYPSGTVNRQVFPSIGTTTAMGRADWATATGFVFPDTSIVNIGFQSTFDTSTRILTVLVELFYTGTSPASMNYINIALLENHVFGYQSDYANGTHTNYDHKHILRHMVTGQWGDTVTANSQGEYISRTYTDTIPATWNVSNCDVAVFVTESHQLIYTGVQGIAKGGTNLVIGDFIPPSSPGTSGSPGNTATFNLTANTALPGSESFIFKLTSDAPNDWTGGFSINSTNYTDTATVTLLNGTPANTTISVTPGSTPAFATYTLTMISVSNPNAPPIIQHVYVLSGATDLIINNDEPWGDGGATTTSDFEQDFIDGLTTAGNTSFITMPTKSLIFADKYNMLSNVNNIYFNIGWSFPSLTDVNVSVLGNFLDNGGNLLISGQDIGWDTWDLTNGGNGTTITQSFYTNYLKAQYDADGSTANNQLNMTTSDAIYGQIGNSSIVNVYGSGTSGAYMYPDELTPLTGAASVFYYNGNTAKTGCIRSTAGSYKTVYMGTSLEMIDDQSIRSEFFRTTYYWFEGTIGEEEYDIKMKELFGNVYPNPTSYEAIIPVYARGAYKINIIDFSGRLIQSNFTSSEYNQILINTSDLDNGIYFIELILNNQRLDVQQLEVIR